MIFLQIIYFKSIFLITGILVAWGASLALFLWALPQHLPRWTHYVYIVSFAVAGTFIDAAFHSMGLRNYSAWYSGWMWFFPLFFIFWITFPST